MIRSHPMKLGTVVFAEESTWNTLNFLASVDNLMLADQSNCPSSKKTRVSDQHSTKTIKRCEELLNEFSAVLQLFSDFKVELRPPKLPTASYLKRIDNQCLRNALEPWKNFETVEQTLKLKFGAIQEQVGHLDALRASKTVLIERAAALKELEQLGRLGVAEPPVFSPNSSEQMIPLRDDQQMVTGTRLNKIVGLVETRYLLRCLQLINRIGREHMEVRTRNLDTGDRLLKQPNYHQKSLVLVYFLQSGRNYLQDKILKTLSSFGFQTLSSEAQEDERLLLQENESLCCRSEEQIRSLLKGLADTTILSNLSDLFSHQLVVLRELRFAQSLTYLRRKNGFGQLMVWTTEADYSRLRQRLEELEPEEFGFARPKLLSEPFDGIDGLRPPTLITSNWLTSLFQEMVNVYGIPRYRELNPAAFMIISFPFFFGLMFGDVCHGLVLLVFGLLTWGLNGGFLESFKKVSATLILMGSFAAYCGLIYNQFFSVAFVTQVGCFDPQNKLSTSSTDCHPVGIDWIWTISGNGTAFLNSFKMKFSIVIGVIHMTLGLVLKVANCINFGHWIDLFCEAIPQLLFLLSTFGYMVLLIIVKWATPYVVGKDVSVLSVFVNFPYVRGEALLGTQSSQQGLQIAILVISSICTALMFFPKPIIVYYKSRNEVRYHSQVEEMAEEDRVGGQSMISV